MSEQVTDRTAEVIRDLTLEVAAPSRLEPGNIYGWLSNGQVHKIDLTGDAYRDQPQHKKGTVTVRDVASFAQYYEKHSDSGSDVFADLDGATFTAVLDAHEGVADSGSDGARWQQHRLVLQLQHALPWKTWLSRDRRMQSQQEFAEFLEDNARDVAHGGRVTAADLLEVAQSFQANTAVKFASGKRLATGQTQFTYTEDVTARAGNRGTIEIPAEFDLAIVPYEDCAARLLSARFRYRLADGELRLGYFLNDPARVAREACEEIAGKVAAACEVTVMQGRPA
jgi:uncharacterized protein YfdQ (DUF2303 family)